MLKMNSNINKYLCLVIVVSLIILLPKAFSSSEYNYYYDRGNQLSESATEQSYIAYKKALQYADNTDEKIQVLGALAVTSYKLDDINSTKIYIKRLLSLSKNDPWATNFINRYKIDLSSRSDAQNRHQISNFINKVKKDPVGLIAIIIFWGAASILIFYLFQFLLSKIRVKLPQKAIISFLLYSSIGILIVVNQFGELINHFFDISIIEDIWLVNNSLNWFTLNFAIIVLVIIFIMHLKILKKYGLSKIFIKGSLLGFLPLPLVPFALAIIYITYIVLKAILGVVVLFIQWLSTKIIYPLLSWIVIKIVWLWNEIIYPIIVFCSQPFRWLWTNVFLPFIVLMKTFLVYIWQTFLYPVIKFLWGIVDFFWQFIIYPVLITFIWETILYPFLITFLWKTILYPFLIGIFKYVLYPLILVMIFIIVGGFSLIIPFVIGNSMINDIYVSCRKSQDEISVFSHGVSFGLLAISSLIAWICSLFNLISDATSLSLFVSVIFSAIFLFKFRAEDLTQNDSYSSNSTATLIRTYWKESGLAFSLQIILVPVFLMGSVVYENGLTLISEVINSLSEQ